MCNTFTQIETFFFLHFVTLIEWIIGRQVTLPEKAAGQSHVLVDFTKVRDQI